MFSLQPGHRGTGSAIRAGVATTVEPPAANQLLPIDSPPKRRRKMAVDRRRRRPAPARRRRRRGGVRPHAIPVDAPRERPAGARARADVRLEHEDRRARHLRRRHAAADPHDGEGLDLAEGHARPRDESPHLGRRRASGLGERLVGAEEHKSLTVTTPRVHVLTHWIQTRHGKPVQVRFDTPVRMVTGAARRQGGEAAPLDAEARRLAAALADRERQRQHPRLRLGSHLGDGLEPGARHLVPDRPAARGGAAAGARQVAAADPVADAALLAPPHDGARRRGARADPARRRQVARARRPHPDLPAVGRRLHARAHLLARAAEGRDRHDEERPGRAQGAAVARARRVAGPARAAARPVRLHAADVRLEDDGPGRRRCAADGRRDTAARVTGRGAGRRRRSRCRRSGSRACRTRSTRAR